MLELTEPFAMSQPAISKHLKVLERAGLVSRGRDAQRRPCRLEPVAFKAATEWLDGYRTFWSESFERLDDVFGSNSSHEYRRHRRRASRRSQVTETQTLSVAARNEHEIVMTRIFAAPRHWSLPR